MTLEGSVAIYLSPMQKKKKKPCCIPHFYLHTVPFQQRSEQNHPRCLPYRQLALENKAYHQSKLFGSRTHMACASKIYL